MAAIFRPSRARFPASLDSATQAWVRDYLAHAGQSVEIVGCSLDPITDGACIVRAADGWTGNAHADELDTFAPMPYSVTAGQVTPGLADLHALADRQRS